MFYYSSGIWAKKILSTIERKYPLELHDAIHKFLEVHDDRLSTNGGYQFLSLQFDCCFSCSYLPSLEFDIFIYQKSEINSTGGDSLSEVFGLVFDESKKIPTEIADSNIWFSLDHPKVHVDWAWCEFTFCIHFGELISLYILEELLSLVHMVFVELSTLV